MPGLNKYLGALLVIVACVMGTVAVTTAAQVFRLRNKRMSWRAGTLKGFPLFSAVFLVISLGLTAAMWLQGGFWAFGASLMYLFIGSGWFISSYFSSKRYITDNGIVKNVNDPAQTVAWHQIRDFFEQETAGDFIYIFIYSDGEEELPQNLRRLELKIPQKKYESFKKLISHKLGRRISCYEGSTIKIEKFE